MTPHDPSSREDSHDEASRRVQNDVSELLRNAAHDDAPRMPEDVSARIRAAMASEFGTVFTAPEAKKTASEQTPIIVPLPVRSPAPVAKKTSPKDDHSDSDDRSSGATVHSFEAAKAKREGRRRNVWAASAAAAAVVIGGSVGVGVLNGQSSSVAGKSTSSTTTQSPASAVNVDDIRITQTNTNYTKANLTTQVKKNASSSAPLSSSVKQDTMTTKQGINSCISALGQVIKSHPQSVHADFGTFENQPAVIVTLNYGSDQQQQVVVVPRGCSQSVKTVLDGPTPV